MAQSASALLRSGAISSKAYNSTLAKTKVQRSKMAGFEEKGGRADQGGVRDRGAVKGGEVNEARHQRETAPGVKGNKFLRRGQPKTGHINREQGPKFPAGSAVHSKASAGKNTRMKGTVAQSGPQYGGGGRGTQ